MLGDLNLYRVFYTVAKYKNISHASEILYVSQPAVSKSIKILENELGVKLFLRSSKGVSLTYEGNVLFEHVKSGFEEFLLGEKILEQIKNKDIGKINIGVSTTIGKKYFVPELVQFMKIYPNFNINIINKTTLDTVKLVNDNKLDLAIVGTPLLDNKLEFIELTKMQDIFVASPTYLKKFKNKPIQNIFNEGSFMFLEKPNITRVHIDNYFISQGLNIKPEIEASNMDFLLECAKIGLGITSIIKDFCLNDLQSNTLREIPLEVPIPQRSIGVVFKNFSGLSIASKTLIEFLQKH